MLQLQPSPSLPYRDPLSRQLVQPLPVLVQRREHGGHLRDVAHELPQRRVHLLLRHVPPFPALGGLSLGVLRVGLVPQQRLRAVTLAALVFRRQAATRRAGGSGDVSGGDTAAVLS